MPEPAPAAPRILLVDDEPSIRQLLSYRLRREGYEVLPAESGHDAIALLERGGVDLLVSDIRMPDMSGVEVLRRAKEIDPDILGVMITAYASKETSVEALRLGASNYVEKGGPEFPAEVVEVVRKAFEQRQIRRERRELQQENVLLKRTLRTSHTFSNIIGRSQPMLDVFKLIETVAGTSSTVLVTGESGTGKEVVARAIHFNSPRRDRPFVALNCGALPETLLESELFGHTKGAFTGAATNKKGLLEVGDRGTVFLDEIGEMTPMVQVKLLRVLQERRFRRLGGLDEVETDIRIIAATNRDLGQMLVEQKFREDLFYRINVIPINLPPLRDRREDIPLLAEHFLGRFRSQMGKNVTGISGEAMRFLESYHWPGNIRELENVIERALALEATPVILPDSLPPIVRGVQARAAGPQAFEIPESGFRLVDHVQDIVRGYLAAALRRAGGVQSRAAEILGMSFRSFRYYAKKYNLK
jgi:two-component system response regulator PilR (NtrC family)